MTYRQPKWKRWHWLITITWREGRSWEVVMSEGTCVPKPGHTRQQMFNHFYDKTVREAKAPEDTYVVFFSLEPDELVPGSWDEEST